jgi:hypothetical protein
LKKICKTCEKEYTTNNKHRTECIQCRKIEVPCGLKKVVNGGEKSISKKELLKRKGGK